MAKSREQGYIYEQLSQMCIAKMSDGRDLAYQDRGKYNGYPIVFLHGSPGSRVGPLPRAIVIALAVSGSSVLTAPDMAVQALMVVEQSQIQHAILKCSQMHFT